MPLDLNRAVAALERWRAERRQEYVCIVSVQGLVVAQRDSAIRHALNHCGMATEDGLPLVGWARLAGFSDARRRHRRD
jgi:UDP-N-acetyl-D-mannosaminuronic acid transferase (WecB/TagA/CpsF family)